MKSELTKRITIAIIGLGLIGGSLAASIRKRFRSARVIGFSRNKGKIRLARKKGLVHEGSSELFRVVSGADLIFVCSPVDTIPSLVSQIDRYAQKGAIVTDVGSTKETIVRWSDRRRFRRIKFVGSHPLAGSHLTGMRHASADLFRDAFVFVTPTRKSSLRAVHLVSSFWKRMGARVQLMSPSVHDKIVSQISHLPHAVASVLVNMVSQKPFRYAASGFLDTTRIAQGDPKLWVPIFLTNRKNLVGDLRRFASVLYKFITLLRKGSRKSIQNFLKLARHKRSKIT